MQRDIFLTCGAIMVVGGLIGLVFNHWNERSVVSLRVSLAREGLHSNIRKDGGVQWQTSQFGRLSQAPGELWEKDGVSTMILAKTRANNVHDTMLQPNFPSINLRKVP